MVRTPVTRRRLILGMISIVIGLVILSILPWITSDITISFLMIFSFVAALMFGVALIGNIPSGIVLVSLLAGGLMLILFLVVISYSLLPPEILPLFMGGVLMLLVLIVGYIERRRAGRMELRARTELA